MKHLKKNWGWYLVLGLIIFAMISSILNPEPSRKQNPTLDDIFSQTANAPPRKSKPTFTEPIQPLPINGDINRYVNGIPLAPSPVKALADLSDEELMNLWKRSHWEQNEKKGVKKDEIFAPLKITTRDSGNHYFVKIVDWYTSKIICTVFILSGQSVSLDVPLGSYKLKYATGQKWYGTKFLFGPETAYSVADKKFDFEIRGDHVSGYTVELILQPNGNLKTNKISAEEFK